MASATTESTSTTKINCSKFYFEWKGHPIEDLERFLTITRTERPNKPIVYLAGDSSLDNKFWVSPASENTHAVPEIYEKTLNKPEPKPDVAFWLNSILGDRATCINTSVEESMLRERDDNLLAHDAFIRDNITSNDVLIVSVGGNDVALKPLLRTIRHMLQLAWLTPRKSLENHSAGSLKYFKQMFGPQTQSYIEKMTSKTKPRAIIVCMIYYPLEASAGQKSWADTNLRALGYNSYPEQLQTGIQAMFEIATEELKIEGSRIIPCKLFEVLDGKNKEDYTERVEPNGNGGRKMAEKFIELLEGVWEQN